MQKQQTNVTDVAIIGGGLAGLTAATYLGRAGVSVTLFEKAGELGGRARTQTESGFHFNLGPHALYQGGEAMEILRELGIEVRGGVPSVKGYALYKGTLHTFPATPLALLSTDLLSAGDKFETMGYMAGLTRIDTAPLQDMTVEEWLQTDVRRPAVRDLMRALLRLFTYANASELQSAGAALAQAQLVLTENVLYPDGGWATMVTELRRRAEEAGARIVTGVRIEKILRDEKGAVYGVRLAGGPVHEAGAVLVAADPRTASALVDGGDSTVLREWAETAIPIHVACLDLGLRELPQPETTFALGIDRPLYYSVQSAVAALAPAGGALVHVAKYLAPNSDTDPEADRGELEDFLDMLQPGWRDAVVEQRYLPRMTVSNAVTTAAGGGLSGRPGPDVPDIPGLYVAGDWVGNEGLLANASFASAKRTAERIVRSLPDRRERVSSVAA